MWPFNVVYEAIERRRRLNRVEVILQSAQVKGIELFSISSSDISELFLGRFYTEHRDIRDELLFHDAVTELLKLKSKCLDSSLDFFVQQLQTRYISKTLAERTYSRERTYVPIHPIPEGYFKVSVGVVVNQDYPALCQSYKQRLAELEKEIRDTSNKKCDQEIAEIRKMDLAHCPQCDGDKGDMCPPSRVSQHGDERWTKDEEEWVPCSYCGGSGTSAGYKNFLIEFERNHSLPTSISYQMSEIHQTLQERGFREPVKYFPVYVRILKNAPPIR
jgi:hypothetical protein